MPGFVERGRSVHNSNTLAGQKFRRLTLGSLFSGSGGFELAGAIFGIEPVWESEIEPLPMRVTERNFPDCLQLGNVAEVHGWAIPKVDIITGGSPCQDMSTAGKRNGLSGERSVLFYEQIRIVKEMREDDRNAGRTGKDIRCRWMCWENVPGTFTSNQRRDFQTVLTEIIRVAEPQAPPVPIPQGGWPYAGALVDEHGRWSVAYRTLDAKFWGVPQRRSRIYLVADFAGGSAGEILFESEGLSRHFEASRQAWEADHPHPAPCSGTASGDPNRVGRHAAAHPAFVLDNHPQDSRITIREGGISPTLTEKMGTGGGNVPIVMELVPINDKATRCEGGGATRNGDGSGNGLGIGNPGDPAPTLTAGDRHAVAYGINRQNLAAECPDYIVRRFTPTECGRLQGFPDWWTDDLGITQPTAEQIDQWVEIFKTHWRLITSKDGVKAPKTRNQVIRWLKNPANDSALYKMWGNGIALPCAMFVMEGISRL